jgi:hypothetical protein
MCTVSNERRSDNKYERRWTYNKTLLKEDSVFINKRVGRVFKASRKRKEESGKNETKALQNVHLLEGNY